MKDCCLSEVKGRVHLFTGRDQEKKKKERKKPVYCVLILTEGTSFRSENELQYVEDTNMLHCMSE